jgi:hypothetical protein
MQIYFFRRAFNFLICKKMSSKKQPLQPKKISVKPAKIFAKPAKISAKPAKISSAPLPNPAAPLPNPAALFTCAPSDTQNVPVTNIVEFLLRNPQKYASVLQTESIMKKLRKNCAYVP